ncbi:MAG TPA: peptidoglycan-binding domain-containing protein [Devosiaceae bacterium]|nr:peptidoglycan-binding domain-containing protein [Devosiaceae bacterium]
MTAATLSRLPLSAGGAVAGSFARGGVWTLTHLVDMGYWSVAQFMRAPLAISSVAVVAGLSVLAGSNALYFQTHRHPAPLFFAPPKQVAPSPVVRPVIPAVRLRPQPTIDTQTTGGLGTAPAVETIDNADVMALQKKLVALKLLDDKADGVFGRHTAAAIRAFELKAGMKPRGQLTRHLLAAVLAAPLSGRAEALPAPTTAAIATAPVVDTPAIAARGPVPLAPLAPPASVQMVAEAPAPASQNSPAAAPPVAQTVAAAAPVAAQSADPVVAPTADGSEVAMNNLPAALPPAASAEPAPVVQPAPAAAQPAPPTQMASAEPLTAAQRLAAQLGTLPPGAAPASAATPPATPVSEPVNTAEPGDASLITKIQRGLASLGFLGQKIDGVPGEGTAKAIRNFEVFYDYKVTGEATPELLQLLIQHGAQT